VALTVEDFDRAVAFYRDALGLEQIADWSSATGEGRSARGGAGDAGAVRRAQAESVDAIEVGRRVSGTVRFALRVEDSGDMAERLVAAGAERVAPRVTTPWGDRNARVQAPDGMQLTLFTPSRSLPGVQDVVSATRRPGYRPGPVRRGAGPSAGRRGSGRRRHALAVDGPIREYYLVGQRDNPPTPPGGAPKSAGRSSGRAAHDGESPAHSSLGSLWPVL